MRVFGGRAGGRRHRPKGGAADTLTRACCGVRAFEVRCHEANGQSSQRAWRRREARDVLSWVRFASSFDNMIMPHVSQMASKAHEPTMRRGAPFSTI